MRDNGKDTTESRISIRIAGLTRHPAYTERHGGWCNFMLGQVEVRLAYDRLGAEWYLKLTKPWPGCTNDTLSFITTPCNYGGSRLWLCCPQCQGRALVLYRADRGFGCRKCLDLRYYTQSMNYRTLAPIFNRWVKFDSIKRICGRSFYKRKMTKRAARYEKLRLQVEAGLEVLERKYSKE